VEKGEIIEENNRKVKGEKNRSCAATLSDRYPSTCLALTVALGLTRYEMLIEFAKRKLPRAISGKGRCY